MIQRRGEFFLRAAVWRQTPRWGVCQRDAAYCVQSGTHDALMREGGIYRRFVESRELAVGWKL